MRLCRVCLVLMALILFAAAVPAPAARTAFRYDAAQRVIKACVVGVGGQTAATHPNPYVLEGVRRSDLTPDDWVFENPLAPPTVVLGDATSDYVVKGKRDYWFFALTDDTASRLTGMDLLYISAPELDLTDAEQDGLRAAVEAGALLWIDDDVASGGTAVTNFPWAFEFDDAGAGTYARVALDGRHRLLTEPYRLGLSGVARLGDDPDWGSTGISGLYVTNLGPEFRTIVQVGEIAGDGQVTNRAPFVVAASYGAGSIVVTTGGVGLDVVEWIIEAAAGEMGFAAGRRPSPDPMQAPDVKFVLNMLQWSDRWEQARRTPRASATSLARAPFPLDIAWQYPSEDQPTAVAAMGAVVSTPVIGRGMVYAVSLPTTAPAGEDARVTCFDVEPEQSLDGDGWPDDGIGDYGNGASYDMVWQAFLGAGRTPRYSSPALATVDVTGINGYDVPVQVLLVSSVDEDASPSLGHVTCYNATVDPEILGQVAAPFNTPGAEIWTRDLHGFTGTADVVALSTPTVHDGYVYVLADEYDNALPDLDGDGTEQTYGRVHCFELAFDWTGGDPDDGAWWVYPSAEDNLDGVGSPMAAQEAQRSLPAFHDPTWVAEPPTGPGDRAPLPPSPGSIPVVHAAGGTIDGGRADALVTFGTTFSHTYNEGTGNIEIDDGAGGSQFCVVPAPRVRNTGAVTLNSEYFLVRTNREMTAYGDTQLAIDDAQSVPGTDIDTRHVSYHPGAVREAIVAALAEMAADGDPATVPDPIALQMGVDVLVDYTATSGAVDDERQKLMGPVRWRRELPLGQYVTQPAASRGEEMVVSAAAPVLYPAPAPVPTFGGAVAKMDTNSGAVKWTYDPVSTMPDAGPAAVTASATAAALDEDTAVVGATAVDYTNSVAASSMIGLKRQVQAAVNLGAAGEPAAVALLATGDVIAATCYQVDPRNNRLLFPPASAGNVEDTAGNPLGPIYGRAIEITWPDATTELHCIPDIERFHHTYGHIRLKYHPVDMTAGSEPVITRPDETLIDMATVAATNPVVSAFGRDLVVDGWLDMTGATDVNGDAVEPGDELLVSYTGWSERAGGFIDVPNPALNLPPERHQMAPEFGPSLSSPAMAGDTIHVGTQGLDRDLDAAFEAPDGGVESDTMLSLIWSKASDLVRSALMIPARKQAGVPGIPVVTSSPSVAEDRVYVGTRMMDSAGSPDVSYGYLSALAPWRVLLCDTNRIVETTGSEPSWVCTGTASPQRAQSFIGEDLRRPFSRPAKAAHLPTGHVLVVDSGNNRAVEIDRAGRVVWPLDLFGYEYYTSPDNHDLRLSRPADAWRYYDVEAVDTDGDGTADRSFPVVHTVVADTGNARVIDIETRFYDPISFVQDGRQRHTVVTLTPTYVRVGTAPRRFLRVRYTSAQPIFDPGNGGLIGYLCAASNLSQILVVERGTGIVNPLASSATPNGSAGASWAWWAWLYDSDPADANNVSNEPLQFENTKHVEYSRIGDRIYVTVTCSRYKGRLGSPHPLAQAGPGVFEFIIDVGDANPANWQLDQMGTGGPWPTADPHWYFVRGDYVGRPMTTITTAAGTYDKRWYPVCAHRLPHDRHLIVNSLSQIESATPHNIGSGAETVVLGSHVFEVATDDQGDADPTNDIHVLDPGRSVPGPGEMWRDPFTQPAYAEVR